MAELGVAYLSILPSTERLAPGIKKALGGAQRDVERQGGGLGGSLAKGMKRTVAAGIGGGALFAGIAAKKGLDRLMGIEDARASLSGLGHSAKSVDKIMGNALNSVKGTAFGMADAGKVAASVVAAGVKPGKQLESTLKLVGDAATIAKTDLGSMGAVFGKVAASNKIQGDTIAQLNDMGIPIIQLLSKEIGKSAEETVTLASKGKINFATFQKAMKAGLGGAALKSGDTLRGSIANTTASLGRIGANFLSGVYPKIGPAFQNLTKKMEGWETAASGVGKKVGDLTSQYGPKLVAVLKSIGSALGGVVEFTREHKTTTIAAAAAVTALVVVTKAHAAAMAVQAAGGLVAYLKGLKLVTAATKVAAAVQWAFTAAIWSSPITWIVAGVAAIAAGLVLFFTKTKLGRKIWTAAWSGIKAGLSAAWSYIQPVLAKIGQVAGVVLPIAFRVLKTYVTTYMKIIGTAIKVAWSVIKVAFSALKFYIVNVLGPVYKWLWSNIVRPVFGWIGQRISNTWRNVIKPAFSALRAGVGAVARAFSKTRDSIRSAWGKLGDVVRGPINIAKNVISGFIELINKIPGVKIPNPFAGGGAKAAKSPVNRKKYGGKTAFATGGWTGPGPMLKEAGIVHADEFVLKKSARRNLEKFAPGALDFMNRTGQWPMHGTYAAGGQVVPGRGNRHSGYPWATWAGDFPVPIGTPVHAWKDGVVAAVRSLKTSYGKHMRFNDTDGTSWMVAHLSRFAAAVGDRVKQGQVVGYTGTTGNSTGPHAHVEFMGGPYKGGKGGSIWDTLKGAGSMISKWIGSKLVAKGKVGGLFGNVGGLLKNLGSGIKSHVMDKFFDSGGIASGKGVMFKNTLKPERVLSPKETAKFDSLIKGDGGPRAAAPSVSHQVVSAELNDGFIELLIESHIDQYDDHQQQLARMGGR